MNPGRYIDLLAEPSPPNSPRVWTLAEAFSYASRGLWPTSETKPPSWVPPGERSNLLAHFDAPNNSQSLLDSTMNHTFSLQGPFPGSNHSYISTSYSVFGGSSLRVITVGGQAGDGTVAAGPSQYLNFGNNVDFTVDLWVRETPVYPTFPRVLLQIGGEIPQPDDPENGPVDPIKVIHLSIVFKPGGIIETSCGDNTPISGGDIDPDAWTHIAVARESGTLRVYQDGGLIGGSEVEPTQSVESQLLIGHYLFGGPSHFLQGYIDELRIIKGRAEFTSTFTPSVAPYTA